MSTGYTGFRNLGSMRYARALELLKDNTTGVFTNKQGYKVNKADSLTKSQKAKIRRYWQVYDYLTSRPNEPVYIKDKAKLRAVQIASQHTHYIGKFNKAFVPSDGKNIPVIKYNKKTHETSIVVNKLERKIFKFDKKLLATDSRAAVEKIFKKATNARLFKVQCGEFENKYMSTDSAEVLTELIEKFQNKYKNYGQWLHGLIAYYYDDDRDYDMAVNQIARGREALRVKRRNAKRKNLKKKS